MTEKLLSLEHISVSYGAIQALKAVSLDIFPHEIVTLIGANGAGKSTLLMSIFNQPRIQQGRILYQNQAIDHLPTHEIARLGIAITPERRRIFAKMTVEENLLMGAFLEKNAASVRKKLEEIYSLFPILLKRKNQRGGTLSGGEQQMLSIGRSLMSHPKLLLIDEPSLGLAPQMVKQIFNILKEIARLGTTILLVEQNAYHALNLADRTYVLMNGAVVLTGNAQDLLHDPAIQAAYLGK